MSISNHIRELVRRHRELDDKIERAQKAHGFCSLKLGEMKRGKLRLREKIVAAEKLEQEEILTHLAGGEVTVIPAVTEVPFNLTELVSAPCDLSVAAE